VNPNKTPRKPNVQPVSKAHEHMPLEKSAKLGKVMAAIAAAAKETDH
jgi:hypothetical protein